MSEIPPKRFPIRLDAKAYWELRKEVLERDGWRCQYCGSLSAVEVHHQRFRSHQGEDTENNLISLCSKCHREIHESAREVHDRSK